MNSRQTLMAISILITTAFHALVIGVGSIVPLYGLRPPPPRVSPPFRVQFLEETAASPLMAESKKGNGAALSTRPDKIEDLLKREMDLIKAIDSALEKPVDVPDLAGRIAQETLPPPLPMSPDPEMLARIDAKVIEIAQETARTGIEIPRRLAVPSPDRIIAENEFPVLRGPSDAPEGAVPLGALPIVSLIEEPAHPRGQSSGGGSPPLDDFIPLEPFNVALPGLPQVDVIARAPLVEKIREERPYEFLDDLVDIGLETYLPPDEKEGFFRIRIAPKKNGEIEVLPKDMTFVIDASNSIIQRKLDATVKGVRQAIAQLKPVDRFNIVVFRDNPIFFQPELVAATPDNLAQAAAFLAKVESRGTTDVFNALRPVVQTPPREGVSGVVVVATDGRPTTGIRDSRAIINELTSENTWGNEIVAYGGGNTVNRYLLDLLAYRNRGESRVETSIERIPGDLPAFIGQFGEPVLANLHADYVNIDTANVFPKQLPDFRKQRVVTVYGRFLPQKDGDFVMRLSGKALAKKKEIIFRTNLGTAAKGDADIARNWAFQKVYFLIGEICRVGETPELMGELRRLCRKYGIRTIYDE